MKQLRTVMVILIVVIVALPLFGRTISRRGNRMQTSPLTLSIYGGLEDLTTDAYPEMYYTIGANAIVPIVNPIMLRFGLGNVALHEDLTIMSFGTGIGTDVMYYFQMPMAFTPYGFGGIWYDSYSDGVSSSTLHLRAGAGAEMKLVYNLFVEGGLDFIQTNNGSSNSVTPIFVHLGARFPLFR